MRRLLLWAPLCVALSACPPPIQGGPDAGNLITAGPEGGIFITGVGVVLEIPRGALATESNITVEVIDDDMLIPQVPNRKRISLGYRLRPTNLVFREPITIGLPYLEDRIPAKGIDPATFDMRRATGDDPFLQLPSPTTLTELTAVRARTDALGLFWITSPLKPAVSELKLTPTEVRLQPGGTEQFTAEVTDPAGNIIPEVEVTWSVVPARVAKVDATGLVEALEPGTATLTATAGGATQTATVFVIGNTPGPTTFVHENPFPTGNDLWGGALAGGGALFVGSNATILARSPQNTWTRLYSSPAATLYAIAGDVTAGLVAVGRTGNTGIVVEVTAPDQAPVVSLHDSVLPQALWYDGTHGMAVGTGNDVLVRRSGQWVTEYSPSFEALLDVVGDGNGGFVTVGARGSLYVFDPATQTWDSLFDTQLSVLLSDAVITQADGSEAWGIGGNKLWHFEGNGWSAVNLPSTPAVTALTAIGTIDGHIVVGATQGSASHLLLYTPAGNAGGDGGTSTSGTWTSVELRAQQVIRGIFGNGTTGYAVGALGSVWAYDAGTFTELSSGFYGDVVDVYATPDVVVAAANECMNATCTQKVGRVYQRTQAGGWQPLGLQATFGGPLFAIAAKSPTDIFAAGEGIIYRYNGASWTPQFLAGVPFYDLAICGNDVWAVGGAGTVFKGTGQLQQQNALGFNDLHTVDCRGSNEVWIAGDGALYRNRTSLRDPDINHPPYRALWTPAAGEAYGFGETRYGTYWDTTKLRVYDAPGGILPEFITGLWGSSVDNLYAVGLTVTPLKFGYGLRFNGADWSVVDIGAERQPNAVHGSSNTDIYIGTNGGGILRGVPPAAP